MSFPIVLAIWIATAALALGCLGVVIAYTIRRRRLPDACRYNNLQERIATVGAQLQEVSARLDEARQLIVQSEQARAELITTQDWMVKNKDILLSIESDRKQQQDLQAQVGTLQEELSTKRAELDRVASERATHQTAVDSLKQNHQTLTAQLEKTTAEIKDTDAKLQSMRADSEGARVNIEALLRTVAETQQDLDRRRAAASDLQQQHDTLVEQIRMSQLELRLATAEAAQLKQQIEASKAELTELGIRAKAASEAADAFTREIRDLNTQRDDLQRTVAALQMAKATADEALAKTRDDANSAAEERASLMAEVAGLRTTRDGLAAEVHKLCDDEKSIRAELAAETDAVTALRREYANLIDQRDVLLRAVSAAEIAATKADELLAQITAAVKESTEERNKIGGEVSALRGTRDGLHKEIETLKGIVTALREDLKGMAPGKAAERYRDLWEPIKFPALVLSDTVREHQAMENTQRHLAAVGLQFPPRVLNAFHTALKTADMSPLVVLAGISGTGKSQLPKRYAEGMGIHFVSLAVQPRWDSPQDLFGFFNHLEKRYKATELARAMVQFERHTWKDWPESHRTAGEMSKHMLLILLDEMNLARVEYYFSEFLSRLEFRRDVADPARDAGLRAQAEIRLDMGALAEGEHEIRLYPDRNILFTGTMNEDESTQTLSDKVLDRACVVRFGRPRKLVTEAATGSKEQPRQAKNGISLDQWLSWSGRRLPSGHADQVGSWIDRLNDCMDLLHRPFAHRVAQAMQQYVANYPALQTDERTKVAWAMADQIEQRILPKLRGIDLQSDDAETTPALDGIGKLIAEVNDPKLIDAYRKCREGQIFMWRGLDRAE